MQRRRQIGEFTRRHALALGGAPGAAAARDPTAILTRPIPSTGEPLPIVGLGTARKWSDDRTNGHDQAGVPGNDCPVAPGRTCRVEVPRQAQQTTGTR